MKLLMLGGLKLESTILTRPKPLLLLAYLSLEGSRSRRDVASLFWGTIKDPMQGLRQALVQLNKDAGGAAQSREGKLWTEVQSDVSELQKALAQGDLDKATELYQGPFLEGFDVSDIGEELEEWLYQTREDLASQVREAHIKLGEREAWQSHYDKAAKHGEAAYLLRSAPEPSLETLQRIYLLLQGGNSPHADSVAKEASAYELYLAKTVQEARLELEAKKPSPHSNEILGTVKPLARESESITVVEALPISQPGTLEGIEPLILPARDVAYSPKNKQRLVWSVVPLGLAAAIAAMFLINNQRTDQVPSGGVPGTGVYTVHSSDALDDVDVGLKSGYFCATGNNLFLSSAFDNQSTALRFPNTKLPRSTPNIPVFIKEATLIFTASSDLPSVPAGSGFTIRGIPYGSAWVKNENCDIPAAQNYVDRPRTSQAITYQPEEWRIGETYAINVTLIIQEIIDNPDWSEDALAFAVDKLPDSMTELKAYSNEGAESANGPIQPSTLRLEYTLNSAKN